VPLAYGCELDADPFLGLFILAKYSLGHVTRSWTCTAGRIVAKPMPGWSVMAALAGACTTAVRNMAVDLAPLRVNCVAPGMVATEIFDVSVLHQLPLLQVTALTRKTDGRVSSRLRLRKASSRRSRRRILSSMSVRRLSLQRHISLL
jgi:NAD(P)-dependent dehydrogenase (short-subunit alcohol dehydrogenase family)